VLLNSAITPSGPTNSIDLRARLSVGVGPSELQSLLDEVVSVPTRPAEIQRAVAHAAGGRDEAQRE
jgi:hypothetical protein